MVLTSVLYYEKTPARDLSFFHSFLLKQSYMKEHLRTRGKEKSDVFPLNPEMAIKVKQVMLQRETCQMMRLMPCVIIPG